MNKYRKGYMKERKIVNEERAAGNIAFRSAGSHSPIDVIIINNKQKKIFLIQSKTGIKEKEKTKISEKYQFLNGFYSVIFKTV